MKEEPVRSKKQKLGGYSALPMAARVERLPINASLSSASLSGRKTAAQLNCLVRLAAKLKLIVRTSV